MSESHDQQDLVRWLKRCRPDLLFWHTPNSGARTASAAARLRREGLQSGIPDLFLVQLPGSAPEPPEGLEDLHAALGAYLDALRAELPLGTFQALLRSVGVAPIAALELKSATGSLEDTQERWARDLSVSGVTTLVARGVAQAKSTIEELFGTT